MAAAHAAPWKPLLRTHISKMPSPEFVLSTLHTATANPTSLTAHPSGTTPTSFFPRARYCVHRGFWANLPPNLHNNAEKNPSIYDSDMFTFTTDKRMEKVEDLESGEGGKVEAVFWVKDVMTQWRVKGRAFVLGEGGEAEESKRKQIRGWMRRVKEGDTGEQDRWSWEREITAHFGNLSPIMRGSFKNPAPGTPVSIPVSNPELKLGQKVEDLEDKIARENFRVVVIRPEEVEQVDLSDPSRARRWRWKFVGSQTAGQSEDGILGDWEVEELWP